MSSPSGTNYATVTIAGAWRRKDMGSAKRCVRFNRTTQGDIGAAAWSIVGSNDETTWYLVARVSGQDTNNNVVNETVDPNYSQYAYRYYRWIEEAMTTGSSFIFNHLFGMFDENGNQLSSDGDYMFSLGAGDYNGGDIANVFYLDYDANQPTGLETLTWQESNNYVATGVYTGPTSMTVYDPTSGPALGGLYIKVDLPSATGLGSYEFNTPDNNTVPDHIAIYGNTDGSTNVYLVNDQLTASNTVITTSNISAYSTYYIVVNSLTSGTYANLRYIRFYDTTGGAITPTTVTMSSGWNTLFLGNGGTITDPMFFFTNASDGDWVYMDLSSYYDGSFNGSFDNTLLVLPGGTPPPPPPSPNTLTAAGVWMGLQLPSSTVITKYHIAPVPFGDTYWPTLVLLVGSTDGTNWVEMDQRNPKTTIDVDGPGLHKTYNITNTTSYSHYRIIFLNGDESVLALISSFYLSDASDTNYPPGYLDTPTSDGYTLTSSPDLRVSLNDSVQAPGAPWNNITENIADPNYVNGGQNNGGENYSGTSPHEYTGTETTTYSPKTVDVLGSWFQMDFGTGKTMTSYGMYTDNTIYPPTSWVMTGSNDTTTWYEIDTLTGLDWTQNSTQNFTPEGNFAGTSYRYYRWIIQSIATGSDSITPTTFFASDANGYIGWEGEGSCEISSDLTNNQDPSINWTMNSTGGSTNYFGTQSYLTGTYSGSISTPVILFGSSGGGGGGGGGDGGITASSFGDVQLSNISQIILSADEQHYIIADPGNYRAVQINLDGTSLSELFSLDTSLYPFSSNESMSGITYNPSKTKFIIVFGGSSDIPSINNFVVEVDLDGTNPVVKMNDSTVFAGTSEQALQYPQCITLTADQQFYLITMYAGYAGELWRIIKVPVNDMSNPTIFATNEMFNNSVSPQQLAYTPDGNFIFPGYDGNSIYTMDSDGTNVAVLYTAADIGVSLPWGPSGMLQTVDGTGYLITAYDSNGIKFIPMGSSPPPPPSTVPPAPTSLSAVEGNGSVSISFTQESDGGEPIENYLYSLNGGTFIAFDPAVTTSPVVIGGLTNGVEYTIQLKAVNSVGDSDASASITATPPPTAPSAPTSLSAAAAGNGSVSISFTQGYDGGSAIINYMYSLNGGSSFTEFDPAVTTSPVVIGGLTTGIAYTIQLKAVNSVGESDASASITPPPTTTAALGSTATFDLGAAYQLGSYGYCAGFYPNSLLPIAWKMAGSNDNSTWYLVDSISNGNTGSGDARSFTPSGPSRVSSFRYYRWILQRSGDNFGNTYFGGFFLKNTSGSVITATVIQNNIATYYGGYLNLDLMINRTSFISGASATLYPLYSPGYNGSNSTTLIIDVPPSAPPAPTSLAASAGNGSASISFTQTSNGGFAIENYLYSLNGGTFIAFDPAVTTSPVVIGGLTNGVSYSIQLKGANSLGEGDASASITVTPATIPDAPTNLVASYAGSGMVEISFTPGSNNGSTIINYQYSIDCGVSFSPLDPTDGTTPITIGGLTNGQAYCIELKAENSIDAGIASSSVQYTPYGPADAPTNLTWVDTLNGTISLSFTPGSDQGSAITNYEYSLDGGNTFAAFNPAQTTSPVSISGLNIRTHYSIVLRAVNDAGGEESAVLNMYYLCFLEGTKILCFNPETHQEEYRAIETLRKGSLVKTVDDGYKAIDMIGTSKIYNPGNSVRSKNRLYKCTKENYPSLTEDLFITGCHSILVKDISEEERAELMEFQGKIYITDNHYRLIAAVDKRAEPHASEGVFNIWHMALENENYYFNYGIYANGLLVETSSLRMMKELSGMDLVQ